MHTNYDYDNEIIANISFDESILHHGKYQATEKPMMQQQQQPPIINKTTISKHEKKAGEELLLGNIEEAFRYYEQCLDEYGVFLGTVDHIELAEYFKRIIKKVIDFAVTNLNEDKVAFSIKILDKCKELVLSGKYGNFPDTLANIYNQLACCYRRMNRLEKALSYLQKALDLNANYERMDSAGITHINMCAIMIQIGNHQKAIEHAKRAVYECSYAAANINYFDTHGNDEAIRESKQKIIMLAIAYNNLGKEEDYLEDFDSALRSHYKAYKTLQDNLGSDDRLTQKFRQAYEEAKEKCIKNRLLLKQQSQQQFYQRPSTSEMPAPSHPQHHSYGSKNFYVSPQNAPNRVIPYANNNKRIIIRASNPPKSMNNLSQKKQFLIPTSEENVQAYDNKKSKLIPSSSTNSPINANLNKPNLPNSRNITINSRGIMHNLNKNKGNAQDIQLPKAPQLKDNRANFVIKTTSQGRRFNVGPGTKTNIRQNQQNDMQRPNPEDELPSNQDALQRGSNNLKDFHRNSNPESRERPKPLTNNENQSNVKVISRQNSKKHNLNLQNITPKGETNDKIMTSKSTHENESNTTSNNKINDNIQTFNPSNEINQEIMDIPVDETAAGPTTNKPLKMGNKSNNQEKKPVTDRAKKLHSENRRKAAIKLQRWCKSVLMKLRFKQNKNIIKYDTILVRHLFINLEDDIKTKTMPKYILIITYSKNSNTLYYNLKNLDTRKFYNMKHIYTRTDDKYNNYKGYKEELKAYCNDKLKDLKIQNNSLAFKISSPLAAMNNISSLSSNSFKTKQNKQQNQRQQEDINDFDNSARRVNRSMDNKYFKTDNNTSNDQISNQNIDKGDEISNTDPIHNEMTNFDMMNKKSQEDENNNNNHIENNIDIANKEDIEDMDKINSAAIMIQKNFRGKLARKKYNLKEKKKYQTIYSKNFDFEDTELVLRLLEDINNLNDPYLLLIYDSYNEKPLYELQIPVDLIAYQANELTLDKILAIVDIDLKNKQIRLKTRTITCLDKDDNNTNNNNNMLIIEENPIEKSIISQQNSYTDCQVEIYEDDTENKEGDKEQQIRSTSFDNNENKKNVTKHMQKYKLYFENKAYIVILEYFQDKGQFNLNFYEGEFFLQNLQLPIGEIDMPHFEYSDFLSRVDSLLLNKIKYNNSKFYFDKNTTIKTEDENPQIDENYSKEKSIKSKSSSNKDLQEYEEFENSQSDKKQINKQKDKISSRRSSSDEEYKPFNSKDDLDNNNNKSEKNEEIMNDNYDDNDYNNKANKLNEYEENKIDFEEDYGNNSKIRDQIEDLDIKEKEKIEIIEDIDQNENRAIVNKEVEPKNDELNNSHYSEANQKSGRKSMNNHLPDLNSEEVIQATKKIQRAYLKKQKRTKNKEKSELKEKVEHENDKLIEKNDEPGKLIEKDKLSLEKKFNDNVLPNLNDPDVINATKKIEKAYLKNKNRPKAKQKKQVETKDPSPKSNHSEPKIPKKDDLPDINDPEVIKATKKIEKAYIKNKNKLKTKQKNQVEIQDPSIKTNDLESKVQKKNDLPDINDPEVIKATKKIERAYVKRKDKFKKTLKDEKKSMEITENQKESSDKEKKSRVSLERDDDDKEIKNDTESKDKEKKNEDLPNLEDAEVIKATTTIQKAYKKSKTKKNQKKVSFGQPQNIIEKEEEVNLDKEETKLKNERDKSKGEEEDKLPKKDNIVEPDKKKHENKKMPDEMPNLEDPEVKKAALTIQKSYKRAKEHKAIKFVKEKPIVDLEKNVNKEDDKNVVNDNKALKNDKDQGIEEEINDNDNQFSNNSLPPIFGNKTESNNQTSLKRANEHKATKFVKKQVLDNIEEDDEAMEQSHDFNNQNTKTMIKGLKIPQNTEKTLNGIKDNKTMKYAPIQGTDDINEEINEENDQEKSSLSRNKLEEEAHDKNNSMDLHDSMPKKDSFRFDDQYKETTSNLTKKNTEKKDNDRIKETIDDDEVHYSEEIEEANDLIEYSEPQNQKIKSNKDKR